MSRTKIFRCDNLKRTVDFEINTLIKEKASDTAEALTALECKLHGIKEWIVEGNEMHYTEEAQDIFNTHCDQLTEELYSLLNAQLKMMATTKTN